MIPVRTAAAPFSTSVSVSVSVSVSITAVIFRVTWYLLLATFFYSTCVASASINVVRRDGNGDNGVIPAGHTQSPTLPFTSNSNSQAGRPQKRSKTEHVILCDCLSAQGIRSSQMAYYSAEVHGLPTGGVASVETKFNTTAAWYNDTTSATWADTGVTFKAAIGYHVAENDYLGKGNNGYGDFTCWQRAKTGFSYDLNEDGNVCAMMIDCNKDTAPSTAPAYVPLGSTTTADTPATSSSSAPLSSSDPAASAQKDKVISNGAVIGIAVGIVGAFIFFAGGASFLVARRRRQIRKRQQEQEQRQRKEARTESTITDSNIVYELDGGWHRHEMGDDTGHYEIDGQVRCEMDGVDGEIKEKMDDLFAEADVKEVIISNEKADSKKAIIYEEIDEKKKGYVGGVSEKEEEVRRDKEEREREREREQQEQDPTQQPEEQKRNRDAEQLPPVSPLSPLFGGGAPWTEEVGQMPFCLPALMPEPEKFMAEDFRAYKEKNNDNDKDETNFKFRFEEETQKYMKVEVLSPAGAAGNGEDARAPEDASSSSQEGKNEEEGLP
ncbi:hypothetical protein GE21DRAFT_10477 [Neurospora crassa]|uniref:Uncharacterized protein n=1 Tax=Neurospora crassa (strain ATCC 24698 / 74-OR23-1A / CBS 708.71 / DSM 1257 / FGSC 987) TaxID=367110 RepID=Q7S436_NEUCR|nr:hypothetical protein NCU02243 [Neurospora crassa OR74A]EAA30266.1 hypothetical protein NCU02243 [Neurospora crassa OR74A]KHE84107.1 hypothetical protein GE21DRAFT_10477 [Neurospora crassa]|eukprot:XP_959502.1 hypothetical protein NCU02243 [Neurospora crassa OR74A]